MGFFNRKNDVSTEHQNSASIIAEGVKFEGEWISDANLFIHGDFKGSIKSNSTIIIGEKGNFEGKITAPLLIIAGRFNGEGECNKCELLKSGYIQGNIKSHALIIEEGGCFEGSNTFTDPTPHSSQS